MQSATLALATVDGCTRTPRTLPVVVWETAASESGQAVTGDEASDAGFVLAPWPSLAYSNDGEPVVLYKDAHFGSLQHDDAYRADLELAWRRAGSWEHEVVDAGEGAGDYGQLLFNDEGRPIALYAITIDDQEQSRHGVWAARRDEAGQRERVQLHEGAIHQEITAGFEPGSGDLLVAFYSAADMAVRLRRLADPTRFADPAAWDNKLVGSGRYDEGRYVSLAFSATGDVLLAYQRCFLFFCAVAPGAGVGTWSVSPGPCPGGIPRGDGAGPRGFHPGRGDAWMPSAVVCGPIVPTGRWRGGGPPAKVAVIVWRTTGRTRRSRGVGAAARSGAMTGAATRTGLVPPPLSDRRARVHLLENPCPNPCPCSCPVPVAWRGCW